MQPQIYSLHRRLPASLHSLEKQLAVGAVNIYLVTFLLFDCSYSDLRLIDIQSLKESLPLTITELRKNTHKATQKGIKRLLDGWIPSCVKIISDRRDDIEEWMPEDEVKIDSMSSSTICSELLYRALFN